MKKDKLHIGYLLVAILSTISFSIYAQPDIKGSELSGHRQLAVDLFRQLVEINTTLNYGSTKAAEAMAGRLKYAGFPEEDVKVIGPQPEHRNLVVRYRGKGLHKPVLFICHLDVVEALRKDWSCDPFEFLETGGYFYGRGTTDIKDEAADLVSNLIRLKQEGFVPDRDIIVALTEGEENGENNGVEWLLENEPEIRDIEYCINPDGGFGEMKNGKHAVMEIQTSEKIYLNYTLEVKNPGGHSSLPVRENAIYRLAGALTRLADYEFPLNLNETTRLFFMRSAVRDSGQVREDMLAMTKSPVDQAAAERLAKYSPFYNAMMRTTCVATLLRGGHADNALPQSASATVNCRMLPGESPESVMSAIKSAIADTLVAVTNEYTGMLTPLSPLRSDVLEAVEKVAGAMWPGVVVTPVMATGGTDGRFLRAAGIPVYGISGMFGDIDDIRAHGRDERIGVQEFYDGIEFMYRLIKSMTSEN